MNSLLNLCIPLENLCILDCVFQMKNLYILCDFDRGWYHSLKVFYHLRSKRHLIGTMSHFHVLRKHLVPMKCSVFLYACNTTDSLQIYGERKLSCYIPFLEYISHDMCCFSREIVSIAQTTSNFKLFDLR